jgi:ABC-type methionine transport system ATPase subunit
LNKKVTYLQPVRYLSAADLIILLDEGKVVLQGDFETIQSSPQSELLSYIERSDDSQESEEEDPEKKADEKQKESRKENTPADADDKAVTTHETAVYRYYFNAMGAKIALGRELIRDLATGSDIMSRQYISPPLVTFRSRFS